MESKNDPTFTQLTPLIASRITLIRNYLFELGQSQAEVQLYFTSLLFPHDLKITLLEHIGKIETMNEAERILGILDQESSKIKTQKEHQEKERQKIRQKIKNQKKNKKRNKKTKKIKDQNDERNLKTPEKQNNTFSENYKIVSLKNRASLLNEERKNKIAHLELLSKFLGSICQEQSEKNILKCIQIF